MDVTTDPRTPHHKPVARIAPIPSPKGVDGIGLVLQGGGALGAYQAGVYQALHEAELEPDWVVGVSIGAINSAIIAGNPREKRLEKLEEFWMTVTSRDPVTIWMDGDAPRKLRNALSAMNGMMFGQPGFFKPNAINGWLAQRGSKMATSLYDTSPLHKTLEKLVDFDLINDGAIRFAVGAVNVATANFAYFDNEILHIGPEHVMASGALPPALPMVRIGKHYYWDGGLVSNTPLQHLLDHCGSSNMLVFQVDLFSAAGDIPRDMPEVMSRIKDIQYSSRTRTTTDHFLQTHRLEQQLYDALCMIPEANLSESQRAQKAELARLPEINIMQLIYRQKAWEGDAKDYEFSRISMKDHWRTGYYDTRNTLAHRDWLDMKGNGKGISTHDIHRAGE
ncbi:MAG TPA: patatin-like phospholipase family protein [Acidocella sp.]|nr:patatin-like phospholipase family protein [Acidocella sp.]HQU04122.1 patatin-like phospholipase family protein [Acidocella sp.]